MHLWTYGTRATMQPEGEAFRSYSARLSSQVDRYFFMLVVRYFSKSTFTSVSYVLDEGHH